MSFELSRQNIEIVDEAWTMITLQFEKLSKHEDRLRMDRKEISFHSQVKLLGHLLLQTESIKGDVLEIGIWKGKSLSLMSYFTKAGKVIGIDPFEFRNQKAEVEYFSKAMFKDAILIPDFSEHAIKKVLEYSNGFKLIHIDGGHEMKNVLLDFLIYSPFIVEGGYIVFDDYGDFEFSPRVKPSVDLLVENGLTADFEVIGQISEFPSSYILRRRILMP
jgi:cephalosporin hydroxylase